MLGDKGLTNTSAQHLCNIANELISKSKSKLENIAFVDESVMALGSNVPHLLKEGVTELTFLEGDVKKIGELNSLIAYLKEAIKEKDSKISQINQLMSGDIFKVPEAPVNELYKITEKFIFNKWPLEKRSRYFELEAKAASLGKFIHKGEPFSEARKALNNALSTPGRIDGDKVFTYTPSITPEEVETVFFKMQKQHREYSKKLNSLKAELKDELAKEGLKYEEEYKQKCLEYSSKVKEIEASFAKYKIEESERLSKLKIVIPDNLKEIYKEVEALS